MDDLISRNELMQAIKRQYCKDCDSYEGLRCRACHADDMLSLVDYVHSVDAVPVVRCKECKHRGNPEECYMCFTEVEDISGGRMYKFTDLTRPDGFCHKGEKMDGGAE